MAELTEIGRLEIQQDPPFQDREWRIQKVGWVLMALLLISALAGLTGRGPLADAEQSNGGAVLQYDRITRHFSKTQIRLRLQQPVTGPLEVWMTRAYLDGLTVDDITPEPDSMSASADRVWFSFSARGPLLITFQVEPDAMLMRHAEIGLSTGARFRLRQFVLP